MSRVTPKKCVLLLSGGPDSKTLAKLEQRKGGHSIAAFLYLKSGHPSDDKEIEAAKKVAKKHGIHLEVVDISDVVKSLGGCQVMKHAGARVMEFGSQIVFSIAIAYAMHVSAESVLVGLHGDDAEGNPQYGQPFIDQLNALAETAHPQAPRIYAPFLSMTKKEVFALGLSLGVDYADTWSCSKSGDKHCGTCGACCARQQAFAELHVPDPTEYLAKPLVFAAP